MQTETNGPSQGTEGQSVNAPSAPAANAISSLANHRARLAVSTPAQQAPGVGGEAAPDSGATPRPEREPYIPRERFDEVVSERNALKADVETIRQQVAALAAQRAAPPMSGPAPVPQPLTGVPGQAPSLPDFTNPDVKKQWSDRIYKDPVAGMAALVETLIEARGTPMLQQLQQQIAAQLTPIQQTFLQNTLQGYEQRAAADPTFATVRPTFTALVQEAVNRGISLTPQTLQAIEGIARAQHNLPFGSPAAVQPVPFSEQPGTASGMTQRPAATLTNEERGYASMFGMNEQEYAAWYQKNGVNR